MHFKFCDAIRVVHTCSEAKVDIGGLYINRHNRMPLCAKDLIGQQRLSDTPGLLDEKLLGCARF